MQASWNELMLERIKEAVNRIYRTERHVTYTCKPYLKGIYKLSSYDTIMIDDCFHDALKHISGRHVVLNLEGIREAIRIQATW